MKNLFISKTTLDNNHHHPTDYYRLSEPTFRHGNFLSRSESADSAAVPGPNHQAKASSLDYRSNSNNNNNQHLTGGTGQQQKGVKKIKCVFLGDARSGKTSLIVSYTTNGYPQNYSPTAFDNFSVLVKVDNQPVQLQICDTAGQAGFDNLRPLCFPNADVFVLCFSVVDPDSFYNLHNKWLPEIRKFYNNDDYDQNIASSTNNGKKTPPAPKTPPILLIGTQSDRRTNVSTILDLSQLGETVIKKEEALEYAQEIGALAYIECSALTQHNLKEVFDACILASLKMPCGENAGDAKKSKIEKARNQYSQEFVNPLAASSGVARKSFKKIKEKMKRSNSVDSTKYASVQVRRQLSSGRINHLGLQNAALPPVASQSKDQLAPSNQEKPQNKKLATTAVASDGTIPSSASPAHQNKNLENKAKNSPKNDSSAVSPAKAKKSCKIPTSCSSSSVPQSPSKVKFSLLKNKANNNGHQNQKNEVNGGRKMSSKSFDSFSCGNATPKVQPKRKMSTKIITMNGANEGIHGMKNNDMMQEIDKLKKGWRKLLCMT